MLSFRLRDQKGRGKPASNFRLRPFSRDARFRRNSAAPQTSGRFVMRYMVLTGMLCIALGGCISTQEMPLTPNSVRIDTSAKGTLYTDQTVPATMRRAALATLQRGYSHFRLTEVGMSQGDATVGATTTGNLLFATTTLQTAPSAKSSATVTMFHENEPGAKGAFDAQEVLKQYPS